MTTERKRQHLLVPMTASAMNAHEMRAAQLLIAERTGLDRDQVTLVYGMGGSATLLDLPAPWQPDEEIDPMATELPGQERLGLFGRPKINLPKTTQSKGN